VHIAVELDKQGKQHQSALNALDQRKLMRGRRHDGAGWKAAAANSIP